MGPIGLISLIGLYPTFLKEKGVVTPHTPNFEFCILHFELKKAPETAFGGLFYLRACLASMHSVAWGTFIRRSFGMSLPVVLQMP